MMSLPEALEPWRRWLELFPTDIADSVGALLMQLRHCFGPMRDTVADLDDTPIGSGNLCNRGNFERLLISEWAYLDFAPDEFIRRAGNGELLFTSPELDRDKQSKLVLVLLDAGPMQWGEPRMVQLALLILLMRRAEEKQAELRWGILQRPGVWHSQIDRPGVQAMLAARTEQLCTETHRQQWLRTIGESADPPEYWQIDDGNLPSVLPNALRCKIQTDLLSETIQVAVAGKFTEKLVELDIPDDKNAARIFRDPFKPLTDENAIKHARYKPSIRQAPRFVFGNQWLLVPAVGGGIMQCHVPNSVRTKPGKVQFRRDPSSGSVITALGIGKAIAFVVADGDRLLFQGFPGNLFRNSDISAPRPAREAFTAPLPSPRWLTSFYMVKQSRDTREERVVLLDTTHRLVCWALKGRPAPGKGRNSQLIASTRDPEFQEIARQVVEVQQFDDKLIFAVMDTQKNRIVIHVWTGQEDRIVGELSVAESGTQRILFGNRQSWHHHACGLYAHRIDNQTWKIFNPTNVAGKSEFRVTTPQQSIVLGVATVGAHDTGLVVQTPKGDVIQFITDTGQRDIVKLTPPLARVAFNASNGNVACVQQITLDVLVHGLQDHPPLLHLVVGNTEASDEPSADDVSVPNYAPKEVPTVGNMPVKSVLGK